MQLKKKIADKIGESEPENLRLLIGPIHLKSDDDNKTLKELKIQNNSNIHIAYRVHGGSDLTLLI